MILNIDNNIIINVDKISAVIPADSLIAIDGTLLRLEDPAYAKIIMDAYAWLHKSYIYDKDLKKIKSNRGKS